MTTVNLSATPRGNGYQATVTYPNGGPSISSAETYPTVEEAITAAALKLITIPDYLKGLDKNFLADGMAPDRK